jgi:hypothetical protein
MNVTISYTYALKRLMKYLSETIEETGFIKHADVHWLKTLTAFRPGRRPAARYCGVLSLEEEQQINTLFKSSGLAGVLLGARWFPDLEKGLIKTVTLRDSGRGCAPESVFEVGTHHELVLYNARDWAY